RRGGGGGRAGMTRPALLPNPTSPMMDARSPRIHLALTVWTLVLIGLVLVETRRLPPGLTALLVPYLALMARHWIIRLRQPDHAEPVISFDQAPDSPADNEPQERADSAGSRGCSGYDDAPMTTSPRPTDEQVTPPSRSGRVRRRSRAPEPEPLAASWVQVQPGRFVRVKGVAPEHPADESGGDSRIEDPHGDTPPDEPGAIREAGSVPADSEAAVTESEVNDDDKDAARTGILEIREQPIAGSPAPTTYLIGC